jgi:katanin p60 ATPase-containing subunit A1
VFIDEIDALVSTRGGTTGSNSSSSSEHEASRRMKTQFLTEMDGLMSNMLQTDNNYQTDYSNTITDIDTTLITTTTTTTNNNNNNNKAKNNFTPTNNINDRVIVLATTNCPWDLDPGILRRLEKRIYVSLPDTSAREDQFMKVG